MTGVGSTRKNVIAQSDSVVGGGTVYWRIGGHTGPVDTVGIGGGICISREVGGCDTARMDTEDVKRTYTIE